MYSAVTTEVHRDNYRGKPSAENKNRGLLNYYFSGAILENHAKEFHDEVESNREN